MTAACDSQAQQVAKRCLTFICVPLAIASLASCRRPIPAAPEREEIARTVNSFHNALSQGDGNAAMSLLAPDAEILETGHRQTRGEYEREHLAADIEFARAVPTTPGALIVRQEGSTAWTSATGESKGTFNGREIDSAGTELIVLSKTPDGWRIRAIHWSSHTNR